MTLSEFSSSPLKILMIDDSEADCAYIEFLLKRKSRLALPEFQFTSAATGETGIQTMRQTNPDILLIDMNLPDMDGEFLLESIRREISQSNQSTKETRLIILTGKKTPDLAPRVNRFNVDHIIEKRADMSPDDLKNIIFYLSPTTTKRDAGEPERY